MNFRYIKKPPPSSTSTQHINLTKAKSFTFKNVSGVSCSDESVHTKLRRASTVQCLEPPRPRSPPIKSSLSFSHHALNRVNGELGKPDPVNKNPIR